MAEDKDGKCDKWMLHVSYQLPVIFSTFSLLVYIKCFKEKMSVNATDMTYPISAPNATLFSSTKASNHSSDIDFKDFMNFIKIILKNHIHF